MPSRCTGLPVLNVSIMRMRIRLTTPSCIDTSTRWASPCAVPLSERGQDADAGVQACARVADAGGHERRLASRLALCAHRASHSLGDVLEALDVGVRTVAAEALDRAVHDSMVGDFEDVVAEVEPLHLTRPVVLDDDVGLLDQLQEQLTAPASLEVERDTALVGVEYDEVEAIDVVPERAFVSSPVSDTGLFHLDNIRAEEPEQLRAGRTRLHLGKIDYAYSFERA